MTENQSKAVTVLIQSLITALLLFVQSFFFQSCMSAQGDIHKSTTTDINLSVPSMSFEDYSYLQEFYPVLYSQAVAFCEVNPVNISFFDKVLVPAYESGASESSVMAYLDVNPFPIMTDRY